MPQLNVMVMDAIFLSFFIFLGVNSAVVTLAYIDDDLLSYNKCILIVSIELCGKIPEWPNGLDCKSNGI